MAEKGLGTGLGALFGEAALQADAVDCVYLPIAKVEAGVRQPREYFDEVSLNELADSISQHGIIQPLTVRKLSSGYYQIIAGERRWRAARIAGLDQVPVRIIEADDKAAMEIALIENLQREDLNPVEEAKGYRALMDEYGFTQEKTAQRVGKSRPVVANALRLLALSSEILDLLEQGSISSGHARALLALHDEDAQLLLSKRIVSEGLSVRQTELLVKRLNTEPAERQESVNPLSIYIKDLEQRLASDLGRKVKIYGNGKKGRLELEFYNNDDLEALIEMIRPINTASGTELEGGKAF